MPADEATRPDAAQPLPLAGIRVVELSHTIMGPAAGVILADMGAEVIKVEPAPGGDPTRRLPGFGAGFFCAFNRNKKSLCVDLKSDEGRDLLLRLAGQSDVVIENYGPGTMERLGCGFERLMEANGRLVCCALKGFLSGPYEQRPALDEVVQFMSGLAHMTGLPGQPLRAGASVIDIMGGMFAVIGILAALRERETSGRGQLVKSALFESAAFLMTQHMAGMAVTGQPPPPMSMRNAAWGIYEPFKTRDGTQVFVGITSDNHWKRFCEAFGRADLLADPAFATNSDRVHNRERLRPRVAEIVAGMDMAVIVPVLERVGVPFSPVARPQDLFDDPQLNAFGRMLETRFPAGNIARLPRLPVEIGLHDLGLRMQAPEVGEHTGEILRGLGVAAAEIARLGAIGVIAGAG